MTVLVEVAEGGIALLGGLTDTELETVIAQTEQVAVLSRYARIERGRRTENLHNSGKPGVTRFAAAEKNRRSEERLVAEWFDNADVDTYEFVLNNGWRKCVARAREWRKPPQVRHPAKFGRVVEVISLPDDVRTVLDPFAGTGRIHELGTETRRTVGVEIEPEWASMHPDTIQADALDLPFGAGSFDAIATSPTYGNRMADHHNARDNSQRNTYRHALGRELHPNNSGQLQWGPEYRDFHVKAWTEAVRVLKPGGRFVLNISDHIRDGEVQDVTGWHITTLCRLGLTLRQLTPVTTKRLRHGVNADLRTPNEWVVTFTRDQAVLS